MVCGLIFFCFVNHCAASGLLANEGMKQKKWRPWSYKHGETSPLTPEYKSYGGDGMSEAYVWALDEKRKVLVTDDPGPPIGGRFIGSYPLPDMGWGEAQKVAEKVSMHDTRAPYDIVYEAPLTGPIDDEGELHDDTCDCDRCTGDDVDYEDDGSDYEDENLNVFGCLFPEYCVMPGDHFKSECHTAEMLENQGP